LPEDAQFKRTIQIMTTSVHNSSEERSSHLANSSNHIRTKPQKIKRGMSIDDVQRSIDKLDSVEKFDHLKFVFETNIDIVEAFKEDHPSLYTDIIKKMKGDLIKKNLTRENQRLFGRDKLWLKRLYPKN
jgi:hypothetical protein